MKILFDHQIFTAQSVGGISRYFTQIIENLPRYIYTEIAVKYSDNKYLKQVKTSERIENQYKPIDRFLPNISFWGKNKLFSGIRKLNPSKYAGCNSYNRALSIKKLIEQDFDIFHPTYYDDYFLNYIGNKPFVLTVHDMIHELYPEILNDPLLLERKARLIQLAAHVIAVSENTKRDIIEILGIPESKISVVYHANSLEKVIQDMAVKNRYILFVGKRSGYKNFMFFATAIASILRENHWLSVICTGKQFDSQEIKFLDALGTLSQYVSKEVKDEELAELYQGALALVFPSYYEGFGIPILEAFALECPVILSKTKCFLEIAEDAAIYFKPKSMSDLRCALSILLEDQSARELLITKGTQRLSNFSWKASALKTAEIYQSVLKC